MKTYPLFVNPSGIPVYVTLKDATNLAIPTRLFAKETAAGDIEVIANDNGCLGVALDLGTNLPGDGNSTSIALGKNHISGNKIPSMHPVRYNGATIDRWYNNKEDTLLASAVRTATTNSPDQVNYNAKGVMIFFSVTAVPGGDTVQLRLQVKDPISGSYVTSLTGNAKDAIALYAYMLYPGLIDTGAVYDVEQPAALARTWRVQVVHSAGTNFTYSVAYSYLD